MKEIQDFDQWRRNPEKPIGLRSSKDYLEIEEAKKTLGRSFPGPGKEKENSAFGLLRKHAAGFYRIAEDSQGRRYSERIEPDIDIAIFLTRFFRSVEWLK